MFPFLNPSYYLMNEPVSPPFDVIFWVITGLFLLGAIYSLTQEYKTKRHFWEKMSISTSSLFIAGLFLNFFASKGAPFFGWRLWLMMWVLAVATWSILQIHYWLIARPRAKKRAHELLTQKKYTS